MERRGQPRQHLARRLGVHRPGELVRATAAERGRRDPRRGRRVGTRGDLRPGRRRLRHLLGDERDSQRRQETPRLLHAHHRLPHGHRAGPLHRPAGLAGRHRHPDRRVAHRRRRVPLLPRLRRRADHHRGQQLGPRFLDEDRRPVPHGHLQRRHRRQRRRRSDVDEVQRPHRVGAVAGPVQDRPGVHADHVDQPRQHDQLQDRDGLRARHQPQAPRRDHEPDRRRGKPRTGQVRRQQAGQPPAVVQLPGPLRAARRLRRPHRPERQPAAGLPVPDHARSGRRHGRVDPVRQLPRLLPAAHQLRLRARAL